MSEEEREKRLQELLKRLEADEHRMRVEEYIRQNGSTEWCRLT